jgi:RNA polymerase sigma factor (sigma-70 family)
VRASEDELKALMIKGLDGDALAHQALLAALVPLLRAFFGRRLRQAHDDVEDLVQEALIAIHTRRISYDRERPFTSWAYAVARYKLFDHLRRRRADLSIDGLEELLGTEGFEAESAAAIDVDSLLELLPAKQRRAIRDTKLEGLSVAEAAHRGQMSESDVKVSVHRGLKALAKRLRGS